MANNKRVFISYAWESDDLKASIWELAGWLESASGNQIEVISDHLFSVKPPQEGWHRWMANEVEKADVVFSVCTPKYKASFEGNNEEEDGGFGVTHEGLVITASFYSKKGRNNKFYPLLPDEGKFTDIPVILQTYNNNLKFHSGNQNIYNLILGENPVHKGRLKKEEAEEIARINENATQAVQFEREIVVEIAKSVGSINIEMSFDVQILIRSFLALSDAEKDEIINNFGDDFAIDAEDPDVKERTFLGKIKDKNRLGELWKAVNAMEPFENQLNPFK